MWERVCVYGRESVCMERECLCVCVWERVCVCVCSMGRECEYIHQVTRNTVVPSILFNIAYFQTTLQENSWLERCFPISC
ncbi:hypothetical protein FKM82_021112 [Ascaphus truei]